MSKNLNREKLHSKGALTLITWFDGVDKQKRLDSIYDRYNENIGKESSLSWSAVSGRLGSYAGVFEIVSMAELMSSQSRNALLGLTKSYAYSRESIRVMLALREKQGNLKSFFAWDINNLCKTGVLAIIFDDKPALELINRLINIIKENDEDRESFFDMPFCNFVQGMASVVIDGVVPKYGDGTSFGALFDAWDDADLLPMKIDGALDYHLGLANHEGDYFNEHNDRFSEWVYNCPFDNAVDMAIPLEMIAFYKVRQRLNMPWPEVNHEFLSEEMLKAFDDDTLLIGTYSDDILEQVDQFYPPMVLLD